MTGTMRKRRPNVWELTVDVGKDPKGKRRRCSATFVGTKPEAERRLRQMVDDAERRRSQTSDVAGDNILVCDWLRSWLKEFVLRHHSVTTHERYMSIAEKHVIPHIGDIALRELAPRQIRAMDQHLLNNGLSARTVGIVHTVLSGACKYAMQLELIERNPMASAPPPPAPQREIVSPEVATVREMLRLAQAEAHSLFPFLHMLTYSGMRRGECLALRWSNVDLEQGYIRVVESAVHTQHSGMVVKRPKTAKAMRTVDLDIRTVEVLRQHRASQIYDRGDAFGGISRGQLVFPARHGGVMKPTTITRKLKTLGRRVGAPNITFHSLRHFHATLALQQKQNVVVVSQRLGHSSVATTLETYGHVMPGWQKDVADAFAQAMEAPQ